jgi:hypothetical protein
MLVSLGEAPIYGVIDCSRLAESQWIQEHFSYTYWT